MKKCPLILSLFIAGCTLVSAQPVEKVKVLFFSFGNQEFPHVLSDSIMISKTSGDTVWFNTSASYPSGQGFYYRTGQKVYKKEAAQDILLYDYSLVAGDSIVIHTNAAIHDTFKVDSVYFKKLNHRTFKAWHLTVKHYTGGNKYMEWIEGLGELRRGWDTKHYYFADGGWETKGMCLNDSIIYWDTSYNYFKDRNPTPTCMFDSVSKRLSIRPTFNDIFSLYPNPASGVLNISSKAEGKVSFMDALGKTYLNDIPVQEGTRAIDVSILPAGAYVVAIRYGNETVHKKILILGNH